MNESTSEWPAVGGVERGGKCASLGEGHSQTCDGVNLASPQACGVASSPDGCGEDGAMPGSQLQARLGFH